MSVGRNVQAFLFVSMMPESNTETPVMSQTNTLEKLSEIAQEDAENIKHLSCQMLEVMNTEL